MSDQQYLIHFGPNANCTFELCTIDESVYGYRPSLPANIIFVVLFSLALIVHTYLGLRWKTWGFMWCLILSCLHEVAGYIGRIILYKNPWSFVGFIVQIICITQAPVFYCAAIYVTLHQAINHFSPSLARFPPRILIWVFVPCDIISLAFQGAGGALSATSSGSSQIGVDIALAGLIFQIVTLVLFCGISGDFLVRYLRSTRGKSHSTREKLFFSFLCASVLGTLARCIFRADELKEGYNGPTIKDEGLFIGLEGILVVFAIFCLCIGHPGFIIKQQKRHDYDVVDVGGDMGVPLTQRKMGYEEAHTISV
ncbi:Efflux pump himE [Cladobotryum mycophilum]|uniref:Efflux pump himE n=1 Tax=Cladobotryum mycophilum TaxID=491253 RepID=A0ABR0SIH9_9HYPO